MYFCGWWDNLFDLCFSYFCIACCDLLLNISEIVSCDTEQLIKFSCVVHCRCCQCRVGGWRQKFVQNDGRQGQCRCSSRRISGLNTTTFLCCVVEVRLPWWFSVHSDWTAPDGVSTTGSHWLTFYAESPCLPPLTLGSGPLPILLVGLNLCVMEYVRSVHGHWTLELLLLLEKHCKIFFQDDEINELTQVSERLKQQMLDQDDIITRSREDYETVQEEMNRLQVKLETARLAFRLLAGTCNFYSTIFITIQGCCHLRQICCGSEIV